MRAQRGERRGERRLGHFEAALYGMAAVEQDFGLDHGHDRSFLAQRRIARERMRIGVQAGVAGNAVADGDDRTPLGEARAELEAVSYTHLRAHETDSYLVCRLLLEKKK